MNTTRLIIFGIVALVALAGVFLLIQPPNQSGNQIIPPVDEPEIELPPMEPVPEPEPEPEPDPDPIPDPPPENIDEIVIRVFNFEFTPADIEIKRGTTVTWLMREIDFPQGDAGFHNVVADGGEFSSPNLRRLDQTWSRTFDEVGEFTYVCEPHPWMIGTIVVTE